MAHEFNEHRADKVMKNRVGRIAKGYATGGGVRDDGMPLAPRAKGGSVKAPERMTGGGVKARADKVSRAKGGRVRSKGHKTNVNVIVAPSGQKPPMAGVGMPPAPPMAAAPPMPPKPPMMPPSPPGGAMPSPGGVGGMPPMPPRADGGRAFKKGGAVKQKMSGEKKHSKKPFKMRASGGAVSDASQGGTKVQHSGNKNDTQNIGRGPVITRATGGPIYSEGAKGKQMAWLKGKGAGGGKARLAKASRKGGHEPWTKDAAT